MQHSTSASLKLELQLQNNNYVIYVINFHGEDKLSTLYHYTIEALLPNQVDIKELLNQEATLKLIMQDNKYQRNIHGLISQCEAINVNSYYQHVKIHLRPKLIILKQFNRRRFLVNLTLTEIISTILADYQINYDLHLSNENFTINIAHQNHESDLNFLTRLLERHGIYYFFDHNQDGKLIITNHSCFHPRDSQPSDLVFAFNIKNKKNINKQHNGIYSFSYNQQALPKNIICISYAPWHNNLTLKKEKVIDSNGHGTLYFNYPEANSYQELEYFSNIKSTELKAQEKTITAKTPSLLFKTGFIYSLKQHPKESYNQEYIISENISCGQQSLDHLPIDHYLLGDLVESINFNITTATILKLHDKNKIFHPQQQATAPTINGIIHGEVKSFTNDPFNTLNKAGCYQVIIPGAEQSQPIQLRKTESYSGKNHGMHFPLQDKTEVFLSFIHGHPDCPVITGAAYNSQQPNIVNQEKIYDHTLHVPNATQLTMSSQEDKPGFMLQTIGGYQDSHKGGDYVTKKEMHNYIERIEAEGDITKTVGTNSNVLANIRSARSISTFNTSAANISDFNTTSTDFALDTNAVQHENFMSALSSEMKLGIGLISEMFTYAGAKVEMDKGTSSYEGKFIGSEKEIHIGEHSKFKPWTWEMKNLEQKFNLSVMETIGSQTVTVGNQEQTIANHLQTIVNQQTSTANTVSNNANETRKALLVTQKHITKIDSSSTAIHRAAMNIML